MKRVFLTLGLTLVAGLMLFGCGDEEARQPTGVQSGLQVEEQAVPMMAAGGNLSGAIFTTTPDGGIVNENVRYQSKLEVYLDGGPGPNAPQMAAGLPTGYVEALDDTSWDELLDAETELALSRTGRDVGTPIITFKPPDGLSFFGPVISPAPTGQAALELFEKVEWLARNPWFHELKRMHRGRPEVGERP